MSIETVGPGGVGNSYGTRTVSQPSGINATLDKTVYNEFGPYPLGAVRVIDTVTGTGILPANSLGALVPYNSSSNGTLTLPDAATAWATEPYGLVVVSQKGTGIPSFAAAGSDTLRATSGVGACVQYGMCAAQIISATEWALA